MLHDDKYFLKKAVEVGNQKTKPYNFGAVVVKDGKIISAEHGHVQETHNPALHAEVSAIVEACKKLNTHNLPDGCVLYASHEPCLMCLTCAAFAEIKRIVFATPANKQSSEMYEFKDLNIFDISKKLLRPMKVEQINL